MKPMKNLDYVDLYAEKMKNDNSLFKQQKMLIESQLKSSASLFKKMFGEKNFKSNARKYLKEVGILNRAEFKPFKSGKKKKF